MGTVLDIAACATEERKSGVGEDDAHGVNNRHVANLGRAVALGEMARIEARKHGWEQAQYTAIIGGGASWTRTESALHVGASGRLVDRYQARLFLVQVARLVRQAGSPAISGSLNNRETHLFQGHTERVADELDTAAAQHPTHQVTHFREPSYSRTNHLRTKGPETRAEEWPIGSDMTASEPSHSKRDSKEMVCGGHALEPKIYSSFELLS